MPSSFSIRRPNVLISDTDRRDASDRWSADELRDRRLRCGDGLAAMVEPEPAEDRSRSSHMTKRDARSLRRPVHDMSIAQTDVDFA